MFKEIAQFPKSHTHTSRERAKEEGELTEKIVLNCENVVIFNVSMKLKLNLFK